MRISETEKEAIVHSVLSVDPDAQIYLFGSRADDTKKGGDLDILIFSTRISFNDKLKTKASIFEKLDEQKIDMLIAKDDTDPFVKVILKNGLKLK